MSTVEFNGRDVTVTYKTGPIDTPSERQETFENVESIALAGERERDGYMLIISHTDRIENTTREHVFDVMQPGPLVKAVPRGEKGVSVAEIHAKQTSN